MTSASSPRRTCTRAAPARAILENGLLGITDFAWLRHRCFGEFDGKVKYGRLLRPGQDPGEVVFAEKEREDDIRRETFSSMVRIIWPGLDRPKVTAAYVGRQLGLG